MAIMKMEPYHISGNHITNIRDNVNVRGPLPEFLLPGSHGGQGNDDKKRTVKLLCVEQIVEETDRLNRLA